jgi:hypothetical protein
MGYSHFDGNEEDIMESMLKHTKIPKSELSGYKEYTKGLLRKKMIASIGNNYIITDRGSNAIRQQIKTGEYWVAPLHPRKFNPYPRARISRSLAGYVH